MKKRMTALLTTLLLALALCVPAMAAVEYGAIYDETEELGSVELTYQGEQTLPQLTEALGIDLRTAVSRISRCMSMRIPATAAARKGTAFR